MEYLNPSLKAKFEYQITNEEQGIAFSAFQKKYVRKKTLIKLLCFFVVALLFLQQVIIKPNYTMGWVFFAVSVAFFLFTWSNPRTIKKNLLAALKELEDDKYEFELTEEYFSIKTTFLYDEKSLDKQADEEINENNVNEENEEEDKSFKKIPPRVVFFNKEHVEMIETSDLFVIILQKQTIFTIPKRCMSEENQAAMKDIFSNNLQEDYVFQENK